MGPRSCIGQYLVHVETKIALSLFLNRYKSIKVPEKLALRWKSIYEPDSFIIKVSR